MPVPAPGPEPTTGCYPGVFGEVADDLEDSRRGTGAHGGSHGVGPLWSATG